MKTINQIPTTSKTTEINPVINEVPRAPMEQPQLKIEVNPRIE